MPSVITSILERLQALKDLPREFENLLPGTFEIKSEWSGIYNCIAFAANETHRKWWPIPLAHARADRYWPDGAPRIEKVSSFIIAFRLALGYEPCTGDALEEGIEKVAIYKKREKPTHMARQLPDGRWISKLGDKQDISHKNLAGVEGRQYGYVAQILCRKRDSIERAPNEEARS